MESSNPYSAPAAKIVKNAPRTHIGMEFASKWRRFFNLMIDSLCHTIFSMLVSMAYFYYLLVQIGDIAQWKAETEPLNLVRETLLVLIPMFFYYITMEGFFGFTIGKLVTGTRVVNEQGGKPTWGQVIGRTFARFIPFEPLSILFASDDNKRGWHDSLPKTWVVRKR